MTLYSWLTQYTEADRERLIALEEAYSKLPARLPITVLAIIPARQGSKRCPLKNLTLYKGLPLITHSIHHAKASRYITEIVVSSDDPNILAIAQDQNVPTLRRPDYLASDHAKSEAVIVHALYSRSAHPDLYANPLPDYLCLLQPTSPNRHPFDIDACIHSAHLANSSCVSLDTNRNLNGAVYVAKTERFLSTLSLVSTQQHIMPLDRSLDIDNPEDFTK